ncbi:LPXTG cell wall anchor domain-containing protein [Cellulomonas sp. P5_C5]
MNIRRTALVAVAAVALVLAPTAAQAYGAGDYSNTGTVSNASSGGFTVSLKGPANAPVALEVRSETVASADINIAGSKTLTKTTDAAGNVSFQVTVGAAGTYTVVATDPAGAILSSQTVQAGTSTGTAGQLSSTGSNALPIALGAGALVLVGAGGVVLARRRGAVQAA